MSDLEVDEEIVLPGIVSGETHRTNGGPRMQIGMGLGSSNKAEEEIADDDEEVRGRGHFDRPRAEGYGLGDRAYIICIKSI